eukprot:TRINITY_DN24587_c0_g1_i1.p2 TRINITY_DN24587_c0_g1~~TRINITY_DN24587_c0_g1_i1.p2  ORF type:complete len:78 (+),score=7.70 TRINITY_DN24587_c0_g1_i1:265-498(+)
MQTMDSRFKGGLFTAFLDHFIHFLSRFFYRIFNTRRMYTTVQDELFKGQSRDFSTNGVKGRNYYCFWSIVDNEVDAG